MRTIYYVILHRPQGSKTWTPLPMPERCAGNFFASLEDLKRTIHLITENGHSTYLPGPGKSVPTEFRPGQVCVCNDDPWLTSKLPKACIGRRRNEKKAH